MYLLFILLLFDCRGRFQIQQKRVKPSYYPEIPKS